MHIADRHIAAFRALARRDWDELDRHLEQLAEGDDTLGVHVLGGMALQDLVDERFGRDRSIYDVVEYVAEARKRYQLEPTELDPRAAEHVIRCTLTGENILTGSEYDPEQLGLGGALVMHALFEDADLDEQALTEFAASIRQRVDGIELPDGVYATLEHARRLVRANGHDPSVPRRDSE